MLLLIVFIRSPAILSCKKKEAENRITVNAIINDAVILSILMKIFIFPVIILLVGHPAITGPIFLRFYLKERSGHPLVRVPLAQSLF
jgi:hypothetical protein